MQIKAQLGNEDLLPQMRCPVPYMTSVYKDGTFCDAENTFQRWATVSLGLGDLLRCCLSQLSDQFVKLCDNSASTAFSSGVPVFSDYQILD